jgi:hypothetical protein
MKRSFVATLFIAGLSMVSITASAQSESRDEVLKQIETKRTELSILEKKFLMPSKEDRAAHASLLQQPNTGLIRLLPREVYGDYKKSLTLPGGGAYYSFSRLTHEYGYGSDIELQQGYLSVGFAGADYGMLIRLGDLPLEEITVDHPSAHFLAAYDPPGEEPKARLEYRRFADDPGVIVDNELYQSRKPVEVSTTYLLRSIAYHKSDVLVAFRVFRKDTDGSVIIAWKLLKNYPKPEFARNNKQQ